MSRRQRWSESYPLMESLFSEAMTRGESSLELGSPREAEMFRFALYNFRRSRNLAKCLIAVEGSTVILTRPMSLSRPTLEPRRDPTNPFAPLETSIPEYGGRRK